MRIMKPSNLLIWLAISLICFTSGIFVAMTLCKSSETHVLSAQAIDQATSMSAAQSALESMQRGNADVAKLTLENQIRQGLVILRATKPDLVSGNMLSDQERKTIDDAMRDAEKYAQEHKLDVPSP